MPPTTRSRRSLINEKLANGLDDSTITSVFRPAVPFSAGYGVFARLPLEVRREIWRHLLLIEYNTISREPKVVERNDTTGRKGEILDFPDRTYDTYPTILWTSKAIYLEASDVFYRENMLVRVTVQAFGLGDDFNLVDRLLNDTIKGAFTGAGDFIDFDRSLAACKLHAMDVEMTRVKGLEECGRVEKVQLMIPASQLYHVITLLHSLLVAGWRDDHFSDAHKLVLRVRNKYGMSEELAFQRLLAPFRGLYAMQRAKITGMKRTPRVKWLQSCLSHTDRWSSYSDQDMHKWLRQVAKLFFITYQQYKNEEVGVAARDAWNEVICNIEVGCTQLVSDLWPNEQVLLHRILFWSKLKTAECEFDLMMQS